jgi:hypothetical protein
MKPIPKLTANQTKRFWAKVDIGNPDKCWPWLASTVKGGYGQFRINGQYFIATRVAYIATFGFDPGSKLVCHNCDNPTCCNPEHFFLGSHLDNSTDQHRKGRHLINNQPSQATKLVIKDVRNIRTRLARGETQKTIALDFNISPGMVSHINNRTAWSHI